MLALTLDFLERVKDEGCAILARDASIEVPGNLLNALAMCAACDQLIRAMHHQVRDHFPMLASVFLQLQTSLSLLIGGCSLQASPWCLLRRFRSPF